MSTRLTNDIRDRITAKVLRHRFSEAVEALIADRAALALDVYNDVYSKSTRQKMEALPKGWLPEESYISAQFGGGSRYEQCDFDGGIYGHLNGARDPKPREQVYRRATYRNSRSCAVSYDANSEFSKRYETLDRRKKDLTEQFSAAERQTKAALSKFSTVKRLLENWPEIEPFAKDFEKEPSAVPAIPKMELNKLLDLPVDEAA